MKLRIPLALGVFFGATCFAQTAALIEAALRRADADGDGEITRAEAGDVPWFARLDLDRSGVIERSEIERARALAGQRKSAEETAPARTVTAGELTELIRGAEILKPGDVGIGRQIRDVAFTDLRGNSRRLAEFAAPKGLVIAMTTTTCPVSKRYLPSLAALEKACAAEGIALLLVNPFASEAVDDIRAQLAEHGLGAAYAHDTTHAIAAALQARTTTEVFLLDARRTLVYRGALDDQYGLSYNLPAPRRAYLRDAIAAMLRGQTVAVAATSAPGCELDLNDAPAPASGPVTYHRDVARILAQNCVECHHRGGVAPFALDSFEAVKDRARTIKRVVTQGAMPPWFAAPPAEGHANPWANDRSLSARDRADLLTWIDSRERLLGDPAEAPLPRAFSSDWSIGTPDLVVSLSREFEIPASGVMPYQVDVVETALTEERWVTGYEILPSARDVVHHVLVNVHAPGAAIRDRGEGTGYWAAYVPGNGAHVYPEGFARRIPAGARISFQIHYTPSGRATKERLRMGLVFARTPPRFEVKTLPIAHTRLSIPPGAAAHRETFTRKAPFDVPVTSLMAHMHVRGRAFRYEVSYPDGTQEVLLDIPRYDFNWQLRYDLKQPKLIPRGSSLEITAVYNNSAENPANPDPAKTVRWGPQTFDEMMIGYLEYFVPIERAVAAGQ